ncbi:hypothetical protein HME9304_02879 [Flagellimonas maritima]|uniref:Uncharacterized protein n=1 Tax=Flagellimonas maritima TaxID=1383885 RepID=A0A2Z4LVU2_9FLAO|nr:DUF6730 family protein [Allomuricauda aurantiaca]AWX45849.1 hypothetical protein HME9304_02879 [Allomuricauda aurantiaca]
MAKLDEIAELLTEEIKEFENSISRLEEMQAFLRNYKIKPDTTDIDFILRRYNDDQKKAIDDQHKLMGNVVYYIKKSMTFPKWAVKLFVGLMVCVILVLGFSIYKVSRIPEIKQEAYGQGEEKAVGHFRAFFEASPEASELYKEWLKPQSKK